MKARLLSFVFSFALVAINAQQIDTIIIPKPFYFTILGIGTEHSQTAIIGNIAPAGFNGAQVAGIFNAGSGSVRGLQAAGILNYAGDTLSGLQISGCINAAQGPVYGLQGAGALNITGRDVYGAQLAGSANIAAGDLHRLQVSGGLNYARHVYGLQATGGVNIASGTVYGLQVSGGVNIARHVKGVQLGVVNFADSVSGAMIGLFSYARHGYHKIEAGWNETMPVNLSFRTGSRIFHNVLAFSADFRPSQFVWAFGYGVGTAWAVHKRVDISTDIVNYHVNKGGFSYSLSDLWKLSVYADLHLAKNISLAVGPSLNVFISDLHPAYNENPVTGVVPYYFFTQTYNNRWNTKAWAGINASLRFF